VGVELPPPPGKRCARSSRWFSPDHSVYRDRRLGADFCVRCVGEIVEEKIGLVYVPAYKPRGRP